MATLDKLVKTVESLKLYQSPSALALDNNMGKREKLNHCVSVTDYLCSQQQNTSNKTSPEMTKLLSTAVDMYFTLIDDQDADVRMAADEHLNKVIRNLSESHLGRMQVELYKEIKKNGSARCLRTALVKFSDLVPQIRLQKCRPYVVNLLPLLSKIAKRREENVHETVADCIPKIFEVLVHYMTESEIKNLVLDFLPNCFDSSSVIRRSTSITIVAICTNNRLASTFLPWCLDKILSQIFPLSGAMANFVRKGDPNGTESNPDHQSFSNFLLGALGTCRYLLAPLSECSEDLVNPESVHERSLQLYELSLVLLSHTNITLVSSALEFLKQLLKSPPTARTKRSLLSPDGITHSRIFDTGGSIGPAFAVGPSVPTRLSTADSLDLAGDDLDADINMPHLTFGLGHMQMMDSIDVPMTPVADASFALEMGDTADATETTFVTDTSSILSPAELTKDKFPRKFGGSIREFLDKDIPLIYCARKITALFLLPDEKGDLIPDSCVRVSIKVLAMDCLGNIITWLPKIFLLTLYSDQDESDILTPLIRDVANYTQHEDCQLRGAIALLLGKALRGALIESGDNLSGWFEHRRPDFADIVNIVQNMFIEESSAITVRLALASIRSFIRLLLESNHGGIAVPLLDDLCTLVSAKYWLVKLELCNIIGDIPFLAVYHLTGKSDVQNTCLHLLLRFVGDEDFRVREGAAKTLTEIIPNLFFPIDNTEEDSVTVAAMRMADALLNPIIGETTNLRRDDPDIQSKVFSDKNESQSKQDISKWQGPVVFRVVEMLQRELISSPNPAMTLGCFEALLRLAQAYPPMHLPRGWGCHIPRVRKMSTSTMNGSGLNRSFPNPGFELVVTIVKCLSVSSLSLDLTIHGKLLSLAGRIFSGLSMELLRTSTASSSSSDSASASDASYLSAAISHEERLHKTANDVIEHTLKLLSGLCHILEDTPVVVPPPKSANLPGATNPTLSPLKKRPSSLPLTNTEATSNTLPKVGLGIQPATPLQGDPSRRLGYFAHSSHYLKLYEILRAVNHSCQDNSNNKLLTFLRSCLSCLSSILEFSLAITVGKHTEELLQYLKTVFNLDPLGTMACVQSLLRSIFRTSIANAPTSVQSVGMTFGQSGLFHVCFDQPYNELVHTFHLARDSTSTPDRGQSILFSGRSSGPGKSSSSSGSSVSSQYSKSSDRAMLASYIRLFEPIVIKALKHYTLSSDAHQQAQVLRLLIQLVQLRVNYCLLDSDKIFVNFIMKQLESIEESHLNSVHLLIPDIFKFLVLLSYEKHHSKQIIDVPRILQLCEGLYASGQPAELFVAPALIPVAEDLFCKRANFGDVGGGGGGDHPSELEAQREVMLSMLLKLITCPEVIDLLIRVMTTVKNEGDDRWRKISRSVTDAIIPQLAQQKIPLDDKATLDLLRRFFAALAPGTLRPVDPLLSAVLTCDIDLSSLRDVSRWLGFIVVTLPILTHQSPEEAILSRLVELGIRIEVSGTCPSLCQSSSPTLFQFQDAMASSSSQLDTSVESTVSEPVFEDRHSPPEMVLAKFLLQVIGVATSKLHQLVFSQGHTTDETTFLQQELSHLLLFVIYMFQSGRYNRVTKAAREIAKRGDKTDLIYSLDLMSDLFVQLGSGLPFLTLQWCYILKLMQHTSQSLWVRVMQSNSSSVESSCLNADILRRGGAILLCDFLCENIGNVEQVTWLIVNHVVSIVTNIYENPVQDFVRLVHTSAPSSGLLLQAIISRVSHLSKVRFLRETLATVEYVHATHSGKLITFLVNKFLVSPHLALAQAAHALACSRMEYLLSVHREEAALQLSQEELGSILEILRGRKLVQRFSRLVRLLNAMSATFYDMSPIDGEEGRTFCPGALVSITVNEDWLRSQIRLLCCNQHQRRRHTSLPDRERVCAKMLSFLTNPGDLLAILGQKEFDVSILSACIAQTENSALSLSGQEILLSHITSILNSSPKPSAFYNPVCWKPSGQDQRYSDRLESLFQVDEFRSDLSQILPAFIAFMEKKSLADAAGSEDQSSIPFQDLGKFAVFTLDFCKWLFCNSGSEDILKGFEDMVCLSLKAVASALNCPPILSKLDSTSATSIAICLADIVETRFSVSSSHVTICADFKNAFESGNETPTMLACIKLNEMYTDLLQSNDTLVCRKRKMPKAWFHSYKLLVINLCRLPYFSSYVRIPPELWRVDWKVEIGGPEGTTFPNLPMDYLQDLDFLKQYILRIGLLGWHSRHQFEETWMTLLSIFSISKEDLSDEEVQALSPCSVLVVQSITDMLLQTMSLPVAGHRICSSVIHIPRAPAHPFHQSKRGQQLAQVLATIRTRNRDLGTPLNLDRCNRSPEELLHFYGLGQVSIGYLRENLRYHVENGTDLQDHQWHQTLMSREACLSSSNLDVRSCLHFLFELYSQWLSSSDMPLQLLTETVRSMLLLSDLFHDEGHFRWMLESLEDIQKVHPSEDEVLTSLLRLAIAKALSVLGHCDQDTFDRLKLSLDSGFKSSHLPARMNCLHSMLYLLQCDGPLGRDISTYLLPMTTDYLKMYLHHTSTTTDLCHSEDHVALMWATAFYIMEFNHQQVDNDWLILILNLALEDTGKATGSTSRGLYLTLLSGLQRLVVAHSQGSSKGSPLSEKLSRQMIKLATDLLTESNPVLVVPALQLFLTCMYTAKEISNDDISGDATDNPELLMQAMERMSILFDCVRRLGPSEAGLLCNILPKVLFDFFPAADVVNRVISEFISPGQPHQVLMAGVMFALYRQASQQGHLSMLQDWVLSALPSFTHRSPLSHSIWCLTIFFICAATANPYLQAVFPYVQQKYGQCQHEDKKLFCLSAKTFYQNLDDAQKGSFIQAFREVSQPRTVFYDLLVALQVV